MFVWSRVGDTGRGIFSYFLLVLSRGFGTRRASELGSKVFTFTSEARSSWRKRPWTMQRGGIIAERSRPGENICKIGFLEREKKKEKEKRNKKIASALLFRGEKTKKISNNICLCGHRGRGMGAWHLVPFAVPDTVLVSQGPRICTTLGNVDDS